MMRPGVPVFGYVVVMVNGCAGHRRYWRYRRHRMNRVRSSHRMRAIPAGMRVSLGMVARIPVIMVAGVPVIIMVMPPVGVAPLMIAIIGAAAAVTLAINLRVGFEEMI